MPRTRAVVRSWSGDEGFGILDSDETPGGCRAHFSAVAVAGYRSLAAGQAVELEWEPAEQDEYRYCAVRVWPAGATPHEAAAQSAPGAMTSSLTIEFDVPPDR